MQVRNRGCSADDSPGRSGKRNLIIDGEQEPDAILHLLYGLQVDAVSAVKARFELRAELQRILIKAQCLWQEIRIFKSLLPERLSARPPVVAICNRTRH